MGMLDELKAVDRAENERKEAAAQKARIEEQRKIEDAQKVQREAIDEKRARKEEAVKSVLYSQEEGMDEPHVYIMNYSMFVQTSMYKGEERLFSKRVVMTEREMKMMEVLDGFHEIIGRNSDLVDVKSSPDDEISEEEKEELKSVERKVEIIKNADAKDRGKEARLVAGVYGDIRVITDDGHAALCCMNYNKDSIILSDELERAAEETRRAAEERALIEYKKEHPVKYTFAKIKDAIKNRSRGRE